jgi:hypothetical protein
MPRTNDEIATLRLDLTGRLERLVEAARKEGREQALAEVRSLVGGGVATTFIVKRGPGRPRKDAAMVAARKPRDKRRNSWSGLTPEQRLARVNAIRRGKGLPPKDA